MCRVPQAVRHHQRFCFLRYALCPCLFITTRNAQPEITAGVIHKPNSVPGSGYPGTGQRSFICGRRLPAISCDLPGSSGGQPFNASLFGLAPGGVCRASPVTRGTGALLPHHFTLTRHQTVRFGGQAVYFLLHFPSRRRDFML